MTAHNSLPDHVPVLIIGAGPTGLSLANLLAQSNIPVLMLDRASEPLNLPRAIVLDDEGMRMLQSLGLSNQVQQLTVPGEGSHYYDEAGTCFAKTGAGPQTYGFAKRNFLFQPDLERVLLESANEHPQIDVRFGTEVTSAVEAGGNVTVNFAMKNGKTGTLTADWVLAADGGRSPIRQAAGINMVGETYGQDWLVIDTLNDQDDSKVSKFFCDADRPHVSIPAPHGGRRYEFMVMPGEDGQTLLREDQTRKLLAPYREVGQTDIIRKAIYTFHARMAERWRVGRIFLAGDAAHLTPPFAGQGMNAGLRDAHNLAWKLVLVIKGLAAPALLDSYEDERRAPAWSMIQLAVAMGRVVMPMDPAQAQLRDALVAALAPFPAARDYLIEMKFKPRPRYDAGFFLDLDAQLFDGSLVGEMASQPRVGTSNGSALLDDMLGSGFSLLAQNPSAEAALNGSDHPLWRDLAVRRVTVDMTAAIRSGDSRARALRSHRDQVLLIRPDRYVAAAIEPDQLDWAAERIRMKLQGLDVRQANRATAAQ